MIEYRVLFDPVFDHICFQGVPGRPDHCLSRSAGDGHAEAAPPGSPAARPNLHQGAIGAGIDLASGLTLMA